MKEAQNAERCRRDLRSLPGVSVPRIRYDLSTERVLTAEFIHGCKGDDVDVRVPVHAGGRRDAGGLTREGAGRTDRLVDARDALGPGQGGAAGGVGVCPADLSDGFCALGPASRQRPRPSRRERRPRSGGMTLVMAGVRVRDEGRREGAG